MKRRSKARAKTVKRRGSKALEPSPKPGRRSNSAPSRGEAEVVRLAHELNEALEQQTATSEVLQVISGSAGDIEPVFATMLEKAVRICDATFGNIYHWDGEALHLLATHNTPPAFAEARSRLILRPGASSLAGRMLASKAVVHIPDVAATKAYEQRVPETVAAVELGGVRTILGVPMHQGDQLIGSFTLYRNAVRPFADKQIALVTNFANQAVIAIENARLLNELRQRTENLTVRTSELTEALEQQTATSDVLKVISGSPGDLQPVFDTMLANATRLCEATHGHVWAFDGEQMYAVAVRGDAPFVKWLLDHNPVRPILGSAAERIVQGESVVHVADRRDEPAYRDNETFRGLVDTSGIRASLSVALRKGNTLLGMINVYRQDVRPFTAKQIELVQNFAAQAVIAIENARLLNKLRERTTDLTERTVELTEALEQQTATSEVLQVISASPGNLEPVFSTMLEKAVRICDANFGNIYRWDGDDALHLVATRNTRPAFAAEARSRSQYRPDPRTITGRMLETRAVVHIVDLAAEGAYIEERHPAFVAGVELGGVRTILAIPMLREDTLIGSFTVYRQEVRPFTDKQIELLTNFAAQAVIAIENARLLNELRQRTTDLTEALEQQTATSEVLQVIGGFPGDLQPVFETMLANATRICEAKFGVLWLSEGECFRCVALHNAPLSFADHYRDELLVNPPPGSGLRRLFETRQVAQITDMTTIKPYIERDPFVVASVELGGYRSVLNVPMLKEGALVGAISIFRQEVRPFTDKQVALVTNFAAQAVIAIENARLLNELRQRTTDLTEALEQQTASAEVLQAISSSAGDLKPVFATMLRKAVSICDAKFGTLYFREVDRLRLIATHKVPPAFAEAQGRAPFRPAPDGMLDAVMKTGRTVHLTDLADARSYIERDA
jgi:GAF domain-containing protein